MLNIFFDTNIVVDLVAKRHNYLDSAQLFKLCEMGYAKGFVSAVTVTDVMYILRKHISPADVRNTVQTLLIIVDVADVLKSDIAGAFASDMKDFEDAVQASCAGRIKADFIVTRNMKDFTKSTVPAILPGDMLKKFNTPT